MRALGRPSIAFASLAIVVLLVVGFGGANFPGPTAPRAGSGDPLLPSAVPGHAAPSDPTAASFASDVWQSQAVPSGFPEVGGFSLASDPADHSVVLFGGCGGGSCDVGSNTTWVESNGVWTALSPAVSPPARWGAMMAWDPVDGYVLLFGGNQDGHLFNDTWAFKNGSWNPVVPSGPAPPATEGGALTYDPSDRVMILYGGTACAAGCPTWVYSGGTWSEWNIYPAPPARLGEALAEDDSNDGALLYGGYNATLGTLYDTWLFSNHTWTEETPGANPPRVADPVAAWDASLDTVVLSGSNGTWAFSDRSWSTLGGAAPRWTVQSGLAWDPTTGVLVEVNGCGSGTCPSVSLAGFGPQYPVAALGGGSPCGNFVEGTTGVGLGGEVLLENGTYALTIRACAGYLLGNVSATARLTLNESSENATGWSGTVLVGGAGNVTANFTRAASNPPPTGLAAISVFGLTFLDLLLVVVALVGGLVTFVLLSRRPRRPAARQPPRTPPPPQGF